jgi:hypothetical protein
MDKSLSLAEVMTRFEEQIAHLRGQEAFHAEREAFHREHRTALAAELEEFGRRLEAFQAAAALPAPSRTEPAKAPPPDVEALVRAPRIRLTNIVAKVVERKGPQERFGPRSIVAEMKELFGEHERLRSRLNERRISSALRWLAARRKIFLVAKGRPHQEALYVRQRPAA